MCVTLLVDVFEEELPFLADGRDFPSLADYMFQRDSV